MSLGDGKVCGIVCRGDFEHSRSKLHIDMLVTDDGNESLAFRKLWREGSNRVLADPCRVARVFWIYGDSRIPRNGFGASCCDR